MSFYYKVRWYAAVFLALAALIALMKFSKLFDYYFPLRQPSTVSQQASQPGGQQGSAITSSSVSAQGTGSPAAAADVARQLSQAKSLLEEASTSASEALEKAGIWETEVEPLHDQVLAEPTVGEELKDDENSKLYERLAYVMRRERTSPEKLHEAVTQIESLQLKLNDLMGQSNPAALSSLEIEDIRRLQAMCRQAKQDWKRDVDQALAIKHLLRTQTDSTSDATTATTIGSKIDDASAKVALDELDEQRVREKEEEAAQRARDELLAEQSLQEEQAKAQRLAEATAPEVKALLAPFLEPRSIQPSLAGTFSIKWVRTPQPQPMSLGALKDLGALDDSVAGRQMLALIGGHRKLAEPKWSIASQPHNWSAEDEQRLKQAQQMLRDHGAILMEAGWLSE